ncbi:hypothetical protein GE061_011677 [Apolygus lucorum]|uniref:Uncharacterized protein n=1 Tax=Apolygus lucorum TaxID=248454 RepID=A0A6A4JSB0_APOLU|nr:hypothetical protein GE061_011677 [Apolygus lucorum]
MATELSHHRRVALGVENISESVQSLDEALREMREGRGEVVSVFRSLKAKWKQVVHQWRIEHSENPVLKKKDFAPLLQQAMQMLTPETISNGFRKCAEDPELDSLGVDIELRDDAMDSDTLLTGSPCHVVVDNTLVPTEDPELNSLGVDIELRDDAMDSDTLLTGSPCHLVVGNTLVPTDGVWDVR